MKKVKLFFVLAAAIVCLFVFAGCEPSEKQMTAFDDDAIIASGSCGSMSIGSAQSHIGNNFKLKINSFTGVQDVSTVTVGANPTITLSLTISEGEFKIVFVKGSEVITLTDKNCESSITAQLPAGKYDMKIVGRKAKFDLELKLDFGN